jgi:putative DNA primase/helicase
MKNTIDTTQNPPEASNKPIDTAPSEWLKADCSNFSEVSQIDNTGELSSLKKSINIVAESKTPQQAKLSAIIALLANVEPVNLKLACVSLGWFDSGEDYPKQKHIKVAIVDTLIKTAKKHNWHIIHGEGFFYIFNGAYWVALEDSEVKQLLKSAAIKMSYTEIECRDVSFVDKLFQQAVQDGFFTERNYKKQSIINLKNGSLVLDERGATLKPFDYRDFLTHQLDFDHNPAAVNNQFQQYLDDVLPNKEIQKTLQQVAGYLFIKGLKLELTFFLYGTGANGKSVFFEVINGVVGSENISNYSLESLTDDKGYHRAMIKDKIVNYGTDIRLTKIDAGMFKTLASGEPIEARLPYRDPFMMTDYAKLIFNVNKMDSANIEHTHGFFRRFLIIPFNEKIPDLLQDKDLHKKILTDRAGVLNWIIEGAEEVVKNRNIFISAECENFKKQFMKETDSVAMFEEQHVKENLNGSFYSQTVANSYLDYKSYCLDTGFKPLGRNNFSKRMQAIGFTTSKLDIGIALQKKFF